jgi:ribosomal protein S18 acetylase RimI-like enzyme/uncharacterized protein YceK
MVLFPKQKPTLMRLFRRTYDLSLASPRHATLDDLGAISRLLRSGTHHYTSYPYPHLPSLLSGAPAVVLVGGRDILAAAIASWNNDATSWVRALTVIDGLPVNATFDLLLPSFHERLHTQHIRHVFYTGDDAADTWIQPGLVTHGYVCETDVVVYEQLSFEVPTVGNQLVRVRPAVSVDLPDILQVDSACFTAQWRKDDQVLSGAIFEVPYFVVAEDADQVVGYAFATTHFGGRLVHLVRIAVLPSQQGRAIGVRLLAEVIAFARTRGASTLTLNTQAHNLRAQRLYEWFGFHRTGEQQTVLRYDL